MLEKIRALASEKGVSIAQVERECGLGQRSISKWDSSEPSVNKVKAVADYFEITVDELLGEKSHD